MAAVNPELEISTLLLDFFETAEQRQSVYELIAPIRALCSAHISCQRAVTTRLSALSAQIQLIETEGSPAENTRAKLRRLRLVSALLAQVLVDPQRRQ
jgi:hypothetical protein